MQNACRWAVFCAIFAVQLHLQSAQYEPAADDERDYQATEPFPVGHLNAKSVNSVLSERSAPH